MAREDYIKAAKEAFSETVALKLQQFYRVVPKDENSDLTGIFVEEVVRGFVQDWISPCHLLTGTLHPHNSNEGLNSDQQKPKQIDGIVFDPRLGPPVIKQGGFVVVHPAFCRGIVEIKTSEGSIKSFEKRLLGLHRQYLEKYDATTPQVMGIVVKSRTRKGTAIPSGPGRKKEEGPSLGPSLTPTSAVVARSSSFSMRSTSVTNRLSTP